MNHFLFHTSGPQFPRSCRPRWLPAESQAQRSSVPVHRAHDLFQDLLALHLAGDQFQVSFSSLACQSMITIIRRPSGNGSPPNTSYFFLSSSTFKSFFSISSGFFAGVFVVSAFSKALLVLDVLGSQPFHQQRYGSQHVPVLDTGNT